MDFKHLVLPPTLQMRILNSKRGTGNIWIKKIGYPNLLPPQPQTSFGSSLGRSYRPYLPPWGRMTVRQKPPQSDTMSQGQEGSGVQLLSSYTGLLSAPGEASQLSAVAHSRSVPPNTKPPAQPPFRVLPGGNAEGKLNLSLATHPQPWHLCFSFFSTCSSHVGTLLSNSSFPGRRLLTRSMALS